MCHILLQNMKETQFLKHNFSPCFKKGPYLGNCPHAVMTAACGCHPKAHKRRPGVLVPTMALLGHLRKANYVLSLLFFFLDLFDNPSFTNTCLFKKILCISPCSFSTRYQSWTKKDKIPYEEYLCLNCLESLAW